MKEIIITSLVFIFAFSLAECIDATQYRDENKIKIFILPLILSGWLLAISVFVAITN